MISKIAVLSPITFSSRLYQKENKAVSSGFGDKNISTLETPNAFYNRQVVQKAKISDVNFGFHLRDVPGFHCPCCAKVMYTRAQMFEMADKLKDARGQEIKSVLIPHLHNLHTVEKDVALILMNLSDKFPHKNIKELLKETVGQKRVVLESVQTRIIDGLIKDAKHLRGESKGNVVVDLKAIKEIVTKGKDGLPFKRKKVLNTMSLFTAFEENSINKRILSKMVKKAAQLPSSVDDTNAFILKYTKPDRSLEEIALRLFESNSATKEHAKPKLRNTKDVEHGSDGINNAMSMCKKCNNERQDETYYVFVKEKHPEMVENIKTHFAEVQNYIITSGKKDYYTYLQRVKKSIHEQSIPPEGGKPILDFDTSLIEKFVAKIIGPQKGRAHQYNKKDYKL